MGYASQQDLEAKCRLAVLVQLTDDARTGQVDAAKVTAAIAEADAIIDSYARTRYTTPFEPVPQRVRDLSVDLALYSLFSRRGYDKDSADTAIKDRHDRAMQFLRDVGAGKATLDITAPPNEPESFVQVAARDALFDEEGLRGF